MKENKRLYCIVLLIVLVHRSMTTGISIGNLSDPNLADPRYNEAPTQDTACFRFVETLSCQRFFLIKPHDWFE